MATQLAFRTAPGAVSIPAGHSQTLGVVDVHNFRQIRVVADERAGSASNVVIRLTLTEGSELVAQLDTLTLSAHMQITKVYDVPGSKLSIFADAVGASGAGAVDVLIYGNA